MLQTILAIAIAKTAETAAKQQLSENLVTSATITASELLYLQTEINILIMMLPFHTEEDREKQIKEIQEKKLFLYAVTTPV